MVGSVKRIAVLSKLISLRRQLFAHLGKQFHLAFVVGASEVVPWLVLPQIADSALGGVVIFVVLFYMLVRMPMNAMRTGGPGVKME